MVIADIGIVAALSHTIAFNSVTLVVVRCRVKKMYIILCKVGRQFFNFNVQLNYPPFSATARDEHHRDWLTNQHLKIQAKNARRP